MARKNGPWSPLYGQAWTHEKTRRGSLVVAESGHRAEYAPFLLLGWLNRINVWCLSNNEKGQTSALTDVLLATVAWPEAIEAGRNPKKVGATIRAALRSGGYLEDVDGVEVVHEFVQFHAAFLGDRWRKRKAADSAEHSAEDSTEDSPEDSPEPSAEHSAEEGPPTVPNLTGPDRTGSDPPVVPQADPPPAPPRRKASPADALARGLASALGSSFRPCQAQVRALRLAGWTDQRIASAIEAHAEPGMAPWDWTKRARGVSGTSAKGMSAADILAWRPPPEAATS